MQTTLSYGVGTFVQLYWITPFLVSRLGGYIPLVNGYSQEFQYALYNAIFLAGGWSMYQSMMKNGQASTGSTY